MKIKYVYNIQDHDIHEILKQTKQKNKNIIKVNDVFISKN